MRNLVLLLLLTAPSFGAPPYLVYLPNARGVAAGVGRGTAPACTTSALGTAAGCWTLPQASTCVICGSIWNVRGVGRALTRWGRGGGYFVQHMPSFDYAVTKIAVEGNSAAFTEPRFPGGHEDLYHRLPRVAGGPLTVQDTWW